MGLVEHAKKELERAGLFNKNEDYGGMTGQFVLKMIKEWSKADHSGFSNRKCLEIFRKLVMFDVLTP